MSYFCVLIRIANLKKTPFCALINLYIIKMGSYILLTLVKAKYIHIFMYINNNEMQNSISESFKYLPNSVLFNLQILVYKPSNIDIYKFVTTL